MRVVLDTNVIIAAFATRGLCTEVFNICVESHTMVISEQILSEIQEKLAAKVRLPQNTIDEIIEYLGKITESVEPVNIEKSACRDADDLKVIGTAVSGKAEFIITGDEDILVLKKYGQVEMISPREFWNRLRK